MMYFYTFPSKLENHPLSAGRDFLFNIFAATLNTGGLSSIRNLVVGTHLSLPLEDTNNYTHHI